jgi:hypothetical protein
MLDFPKTFPVSSRRHRCGPRSLVSGLTAGSDEDWGSISSVDLLSSRSLSRVLLGLGFSRCRCSAVELGFASGVWLLCVLVFLVASRCGSDSVVEE